MIRERDAVAEAGLQRCCITGSEDGRKRLQAKECGCPLKAEKARKWILS